MLQPLKYGRRVVLSSINIKKWFLKLIRGITVILSNNYNQWDIIRTCWNKNKFKLLINNHLSSAWRVNIFKMFRYLFLSTLGPQPTSYTAGASLGEELIGPSSLGAADFILRGIVHQVKLLQLPDLMTVAQPWHELLQFIKSIWPRSNYVASNWQEVPGGFFSKGCTCCSIS